MKEAHLTKEPEGVSIQFPPIPSICLDPESLSTVFSQLVFGNDAAAFKMLGEVGMAE